jgi:benzoyl-CoA reductase/2-hydroxyglutaryl-CoA dehydratase subunit BcrC/BadD/HgdB
MVTPFTFVFDYNTKVSKMKGALNVLDKKYEDQILKSMDAVREKAPDIPLDYFFDIWKGFWFGEQKTEMPSIAVLGTGIPELYIRATGAKPLFLLGGNYFTDQYAEHVFPQISDPVLKSASSILFSEQLACMRDITAMVVPVSNADTRKVLPYFKDLGHPVIVMEEEPFLDSKATSRFRSSQMDLVMELQKLTHRPITAKSIRTAAKQITSAHDAIRRLKTMDIPQIAKDFIKQTYYLAPDIQEWTDRVNGFAEENLKPMPENRSHLLLIGSPIFFPNVKIPTVLHNVGIRNYENHCGVPDPEDYTELMEHDPSSLNSMFRDLNELHYRSAQNDIARALCSDTSFLQNASGVIYHLLKGQLMYAYEANRIEKAAIRAGIPFVCIETDYTNADIEQIRIRLEAFSELLMQTGRLSAAI